MKSFCVLLVGLMITSCCIERPKIRCYYSDGTRITDTTHLNLIYRQLPKLLSQSRIDSTGFDVYTSLKPHINNALTGEVIRLQDSVYPYIKWEHRETKALMDSLKTLNQFLNVGVVAIDNKTGQVLVHYSSKSKPDGDFVTNRGPIGGMNKTLLYALAMWKEFTPYDRYPQMKQVPDGDFDDLIPDSSINRSFLRSFSISFGGTFPFGLAQRYSDKQAYSFLYQLGIAYPENYGHPLTLFDVQLSLLELTKTWSAFYNNGILNEPTIINRIVDLKGQELFHRKLHSKRVLDEETMEEMLHLLDQYSNRGVGAVIAHRYENVPAYLCNFGRISTRNGSGIFIAITKKYTIGVRCVPTFQNIRIHHPFNANVIPFTVPLWLRSLEKLQQNRPKEKDELTPLYKFRPLFEEEKILKSPFK
jgi:membrane peptidoglycan carboxypeptidase